MNCNTKRRCSLVLALLVIYTALCTALNVSASTYTGTVDAFSYYGYSIPRYDGDVFETVNGNIPRFADSELTQTIYETYGALDTLGRVTACSANIDQSLMPTEKRGDISSVYPTGWKQKKYDFVSDKYLYNRSHLIGWQLTGENANKNNLMTGTRTFNAVGMLPFENAVAAYVKENAENNVLYRVTPVFAGDNLLAYGVIMEAKSVDDNGAVVQFCVFVYNVEPRISIDYATGDSIQTGTTIDLSAAYIYLKSTKYTYAGKAFTPLDSVKLRGILLTKDKDYTVSYKNNKKVGTATITVTGTGNYSGTVQKTFKIYPKGTGIAKITAKKKGFAVKWNKQATQTTGYQLQYSTNKDFKNAKTVTVDKNTTTTKTVSKLKAKKKYFVRVRTYKTVNNTKYFSAWSKAKTVTTKK